ncbi:unnamed protein product [Notodromas monacha]|uniref:COP9 signalosome complex subunit 9 n=1 Tax=Notodromas monacha TaxID=399045 RepID=A0A7R9BG79_9CRUS|nr:unnamed protein product [Notodromas monacha]CAG0913874.1 unnamed protein product [Notodromas monacha]
MSRQRFPQASWQKSPVVVDEMFPEGCSPYMDLEEAGGSSGLLFELTANEKAVHADFFNDFGDLFDDGIKPENKG